MHLHPNFLGEDWYLMNTQWKTSSTHRKNYRNYENWNLGTQKFIHSMACWNYTAQLVQNQLEVTIFKEIEKFLMQNISDKYRKRIPKLFRRYSTPIILEIWKMTLLYLISGFTSFVLSICVPILKGLLLSLIKQFTILVSSNFSVN